MGNKDNSFGVLIKRNPARFYQAGFLDKSKVSGCVRGLHDRRHLGVMAVEARFVVRLALEPIHRQDAGL
jgi:hypothetical protein